MGVVFCEDSGDGRFWEIWELRPEGGEDGELVGGSAEVFRWWEGKGYGGGVGLWGVEEAFGDEVFARFGGGGEEEAAELVGGHRGENKVEMVKFGVEVGIVGRGSGGGAGLGGGEEG